MRNVHLRFGALLGLMVLLACSLCAQEPEHVPLRVTVEPAALLTVNHKTISEGTTFQVMIPARQETLLRLSRPGYQTEYRVVRPYLSDRPHESFQLKHEKIPVLFRSNTQAMVLCDGQELGETPLHFFFNEPKVYRIVFRSDGYDDHAVRLDLEDGRPEVVDAELTSDSITLDVKSQPSGATILINGLRRGITPAAFPRLRAGMHTIVIRKDGYHDYEQTVELKAGEHFSLNPVMEKLSAGLSVKSTPSGAMVYLNGIQYGTTPLQLNNLSDGNYALRLEKKGYETEVRTVRLIGGVVTEERSQLKLQNGELAIQTQPAEVLIIVDGKRMLTTHPETQDSFTSAVATLKLPIGEHTILFQADGFADAIRKVTIKPNGNEILKIRLEFKPNFEIRTATSVYRGVFVRRDVDGAVSLELRPGVYRTFSASEIRSARFWSEKE